MKRKSVFLIFSTLLAFLFLGLSACSEKKPQNNFSEQVKVALRKAGNTILLADNDSVSLIPPIIQKTENQYEMAFDNKLSIVPDSLVNAVGKSLKAANLPKRYIVEVRNCNDNEVAYSFQIMGAKEKDIVPCLGRNLPTNCYTIQVIFVEKRTFLSQTTVYLFLGILLIPLIVLLYAYKKKRSNKIVINADSAYTKIGLYKFYIDQNKLTKDAVEIKLSAKECELMAMFSANQNQVIKREILVKEIWEDNGVYVDRSLDTFISKLRKKFKNDDSIQFENVHGVGYKLVVQ